MQFLRFLFACIVLIFCIHSATAIPQSLVLRQDDASSSRPNTPSVTTSFRPSATASLDDDESASTMESRHVTPTSVVSTSATEAITSFQVPVTVSAAPQSTSPTGELSKCGHVRRILTVSRSQPGKSSTSPAKLDASYGHHWRLAVALGHRVCCDWYQKQVVGNPLVLYLRMSNLGQGLRIRVRCVSIRTSRHCSHRLSHEPSRLQWHPRRFLCCCILHGCHIWRRIVGLFGYHRGLWVPSRWILFEHVVSMPQVRWPYHVCDWSRNLHWMHERWWLLLIL